MIEMLPGLPDGVIGFKAVGEVTSSDYTETLIPAVDAVISEHGKARLLYVLGDEFTGYSGGGMWEDTKIGFEKLRDWEKIGVVSNNGWVLHGIKAFGWMVPGEVKVFALDQMTAAEEWVAM